MEKYIIITCMCVVFDLLDRDEGVKGATCGGWDEKLEEETQTQTQRRGRKRKREAGDGTESLRLVLMVQLLGRRKSNWGAKIKR